MLGNLYDALISAGAEEPKARAAAVEAAEFDSRFVKLEQAIASLRAEMNARFAQHDGEFKLLRWMVGINSAITLAVLIKLLLP